MEYSQAEKLSGSQDERRDIVQELRVRQIELERENGELKKALSEMAEMERYTALFDFAPVGHFFLDGSGTVLRVNRSGLRLLGVERDDLTGRSFLSFVADDFRSAFHACLDAALASRVKETCELMLRREGGQPFSAHIEAKAAEGGHHCFFRVVDITDIKKMEERLKQSESLLKEAQHLAHISHWVIDPATGASTWSEEVFRIFGQDPGQEAPSLVARDGLIHHDDLDRFNEAIQKAISEGASFDIVYRLVRPDKSIRWVNTRAYADKNDEGQVVRLFGAVQDITELLQLQEELKKSQAQLKSSAIAFHRANIRKKLGLARTDNLQSKLRFTS